eukprot:COSAG01_NODE_6140_length_3827_cov_5.215607_1_plen_146_part_00
MARVRPRKKVKKQGTCQLTSALLLQPEQPMCIVHQPRKVPLASTARNAGWMSRMTMRLELSTPRSRQAVRLMTAAAAAHHRSHRHLARSTPTCQCSHCSLRPLPRPPLHCRHPSGRMTTAAMCCLHLRLAAAVASQYFLTRTDTT